MKLVFHCCVSFNLPTSNGGSDRKPSTMIPSSPREFRLSRMLHFERVYGHARIYTWVVTSLHPWPNLRHMRVVCLCMLCVCISNVCVPCVCAKCVSPSISQNREGTPSPSAAVCVSLSAETHTNTPTQLEPHTPCMHLPTRQCKKEARPYTHTRGLKLGV